MRVLLLLLELLGRLFSESALWWLSHASVIFQEEPRLQLRVQDGHLSVVLGWVATTCRTLTRRPHAALLLAGTFSDAPAECLGRVSPHALILLLVLDLDSDVDTLVSVVEAATILRG